MITLRFRKPARLACMTILAGTATLLLAETISAPAHAASKGASTKKVLGACSRTAGCQWSIDPDGNVSGCSPHACFTCNGTTGTCKPLVEKGTAGRLRTGTGSNAGTTTANSGTSNNAGNRRPIDNISHTTATRRH